MTSKAEGRLVLVVFTYGDNVRRGDVWQARVIDIKTSELRAECETLLKLSKKNPGYYTNIEICEGPWFAEFSAQFPLISHELSNETFSSGNFMDITSCIDRSNSSFCFDFYREN